MNKNSKYGPQSFEGMELQKEDNHPVDVKKELTELSAELADKLKAVSEKNQSQIQTLEEVLSKLEQVMKKLWEAGGYVDEMLDDIKRYKDKGLELSDNAQKQFQLSNLPAAFMKH